VGQFAFGGNTIVRPGILVSSNIGAQQVLQLLPFGTIAMIGPSDGGAGDGAIYSFNDMGSAQRVLRSGPLYDALLRAANVGGASGFIAVVAGTKTPATLALTGAATGEALPRSVAMTPASMTNIVVGDRLYLDYGTSDSEEVTVTAVTGSTFSAEVTLPHAAGFTVKNNPSAESSGTTTEAITSSGSAQAVTVTSLGDIAVGDQVTIDTAGNAETVTVTAIGSSEFSAIFTKDHADGVAYAIVPVNTTVATAITGTVTPAATLTSGDQGTWNNGITYACAAGTTDGTVAVTIAYPDSISGQQVYVGGLKTPFDNLTTYSQLAAAILANNVLTPPAATGLPAIVALTVATDGLPATLATTPLAGGTGSGSQTLEFTDFKAAIDAMINVNFDIGHIVQCYDNATQAYADAQATLVQGYGRLRRWIHQVQASGASSSNIKTVNSEAVANALIGAASSLNSFRSSVFAQQVAVTNPQTGNTEYVDVAPLVVGLAALSGATGANGPATPLTYTTIPGALAVDYPVLDTTGDTDNAILAGGCVIEQVGFGSSSIVRIVQSVTTAPNDSSGNPWIFAEFSVVRVGDALLANCIAACQTSNPKVIGGGNTVAVQQAALADVRDVLELALTSTWITNFDPSSLSIAPTGGTGTDDILSYSASPTLPLNHLGIAQTLMPFEGPVSLGGTVNG
jgi:hypothetical protein